MGVVVKTYSLENKPYSRKLKEIYGMLFRRLREEPVEEIELRDTFVDSEVAEHVLNATIFDDYDARIEIVTLREDVVYVYSELYHIAGYVVAYHYIAIEIDGKWAIVPLEYFSD